LKVFIADDSALMRERLAAMLSELPEIEIIGQARDGLEAIGLIPKLKPDVVILDVRMPKRSGVNILQNIKGGVIPPLVIMFTNYPYPQYRDKCLKMGADFFFDKSTDVERLIQVLNTLAQEAQKTNFTNSC
jgi:DNA-binding NarL/FixJ family response regulator